MHRVGPSVHKGEKVRPGEYSDVPGSPPRRATVKMADLISLVLVCCWDLERNGDVGHMFA